MKEYYCGLDVSSKSVSVCVIDENHKVKLEGECPTETEELGRVLKKFKKLRCVVEAAPLAEWICRVVEGCGHKVTIICPRRAKGVMSTRKKTDRIDAKNLAELCLGGWYTAVHRKSGAARELRSCLTARKQVVQAASALQSAIRGIFRRRE